METPSSTRRVTRSQTASSANSNVLTLSSRKIEEPETAISKSRQKSGKKPQKDRSALIDITNDSPIIGLAMGNLETPSSAVSKKRITSRTPGSGEALLRGQVKTLLQKVEEEAGPSKITLKNHRASFSLVNSPMDLLAAPTPANTPQVLNLCVALEMVNGMFDEKEEEGIEEWGNDVITRALLFDFSDKSERSDESECSSVVTYQGASHEGCVEKVSSPDDDDASNWSIQVNASSPRDDEEENEGYVEEEDGCDYDEGECDFVDDSGVLLDELCEGMRNVSINEGPKFSGKHIRFLYNSDDELEGEEECEILCGPDEDDSVSPIEGEEECELFGPDEDDCMSWMGDGVMHLKGLPTPKGKHLRFPGRE